MSEEKEETSLDSLEDFQDPQEKPEIVVSDNPDEQVVQQNLVNIVALFEKQDWLETKSLVEMQRLSPERAGEIIQAKISDRKQTLELVQLSMENEKIETDKYYRHVAKTEMYRAIQNFLAVLLAGIAFFGVLYLCYKFVEKGQYWPAVFFFFFSLTAIAYLSGREQPKKINLSDVKDLIGGLKKDDK
jgi:hypothetical protein